MYADDDFSVFYLPTADLNQDGFEVIEEPISQNDLWVVISSFFDEKGLVQQQLSSFNEFVENTLNDVMDEHVNLTLDQIAQNSGANYDQSRRFHLSFEQVFLGGPSAIESDGTGDTTTPQEARLRSGTYDSPLYMKVSQKVRRLSEDRQFNGEPEWIEDDIYPDVEIEKAYVGRVRLYITNNASMDTLDDTGECPFDMGGNFIVNGSEKTNNVMRATLPYVRQNVPIMLIFRGLGILPDREIVKHVVYDVTDGEMTDLVQPSIEEGFAVQEQHIALDQIGRRGNVGLNAQDKRIKHAEDILARETLPHISTKADGHKSKAYFFGCMVHRLILAKLERRDLDDRDHFGKKRLDLAGPLLANLFRLSFRKYTRDIYRHQQKCTDQNRAFENGSAINKDAIEKGMRYSIATGDCGEHAKWMEAKAGVSQVLNRYTYASTLSHLRRTNTLIGHDGKIA